MLRSIRNWMLVALPVAGLMLSPFVSEAEAASKKRVRTVRNGTIVTPYGTIRNLPDGPLQHNMNRLSYRVPRRNPVPNFGYYGSQHYYSTWVPSNYYNFW